MVTTITEHTWYTQYEDDVFNHDKTVAIVFGAEWCESCHKLIGTLDRETFPVEILHMDVDTCDSLADEYGITSLPTVVIFQNGEVSTVLSNNTTTDDIIKELGELS